MRISRKELSRTYPFADHYHDLDGIAYHYVDEGEGEPVVMLHGNTTWSYYYRHLILDLRDRFRCVAPDHVGCGLSDKPQDYEYTLRKHIDNFTRFMDDMDLGDVTLVLHDWGGGIGMGWAVDHPDRIKRLVVLNTAAFFGPRIPLRIRVCRIPVFGAVAVRGFNAFAALAPMMAAVNKDRMTPEVRRAYIAPYDSWAHRIAVHRFVQDIPMEKDHPTRVFGRKLEEGLTVLRDKPMIVLWGKQDFCFHDGFMDEWRKRFPRAQITVYEDAGHYVMEDARDRVIPAIRQFIGTTV
jgi:cis-3-alkyl-4-acyloxetan-2-one decarboxylase